MSPEEEDCFLLHWQFLRLANGSSAKPTTPSPLRSSTANDIATRFADDPKSGDAETLFVALVHFAAFGVARDLFDRVDLERASQLHLKFVAELKKAFGIRWTDAITVVCSDETDRQTSVSAMAVAAMKRHSSLVRLKLEQCDHETAAFVRQTMGIWNSDPGPLDVNALISSIRSPEAYTKFCFVLLITGHYELFSFLGSDKSANILLEWERLIACGSDAKTFLINHWRKNISQSPKSANQNSTNGRVLAESSNLERSRRSDSSIAEELGSALNFSVDKTDSSRAVDLAYYRAEKGNIYKNFSVPKGLVMIINNEYFNCEHLGTRHGTQIDERCLQKLFTDLGYSVMETYRDLKHDEMMSEARNFALNPAHQFAHSAVIVVLTHGENDCLMGVNGKSILTHAFLNCFNAQSAPFLAGKPKFFIIQACRGAHYDLGTACPVPIDDVDSRSRSPSSNSSVFSNLFSFLGMSKSPRSSLRRSKRSNSPVILRSAASIPTNSFRLTTSQMQALYPPEKYQFVKKPVSADMIMAYATVPHHVSWRNTQYGSWFIQSLCKVFAEYAHCEDLLTMLTRVNKLVSTGYESTNESKAKQIPEFSVRLEKKFYLFPGVTSED